MRYWVAFIVLCLMFTGNNAKADEQTPKDVTEYKFTDINVDGETISPNQDLVTVRRPAFDRSLIRVRNHFVPEMMKSVENL